MTLSPLAAIRQATELVPVVNTLISGFERFRRGLFVR